MNEPKSPVYVWFNDHGKGRNQVAAFRLAFDLSDAPLAADLHLFVDCAYQLFVNERFVTFGPVRFDPKFPLYDSVDLKPYLRPGRNVLAIQAKAFGVKTFKAIAGHGGMTCWGSVQPAKGPAIDLATGVADWKCVRHESYDQEASKLSFALDACDIFDQAKEPPDWKATGTEDKHWPRAVVLKDQSIWGELKPRSIPLFTPAPLALAAKARVLPLKAQEDVFTFSVPTPFQEDSTEAMVIPYATWIYSPKEQEVTLAKFWGDDSLNGTPLDKGHQADDQSMRINQRVRLQKGWNHFCGWVTVYSNVYSFFLGFPKDCGVVFSPNKKMDDPVGFLRGPLQPKDSFVEKLAGWRPLDPSGAGQEQTKDWIECRWDAPAHDPCRWTSWDFYGPVFETLSWPVGEKSFPLARYPDGFALLIDLGFSSITFPVLEMSGVEGAIIDVTYTEHLNSDHLHFTHKHYFPLGDRILCARPSIQWRPSQPRGLRYLKVTVRGATQDVTLHRLELESASYPVVSRGAFKCSDPLLTSIWEMCRRTQESNMEDAYVDCPGRERGMYGRDTIIQYHVNLATFGDQALMRRCFELYGQSPDETGKFRAVYPNTGDYTIADFALDMVDGYWNYYQHSGDASLLRECWPAILKNLQWFHDLADERPDGLLDSDWPKNRKQQAHYGGSHGDLGIPERLQAKGGINIALNCLYLIALESAVRIGDVVGDTKQGEPLQRRADRLREKITAGFWNEKRGIYADTLDFTTHSPHASLLAISSGAATERQLPLLRENLRQSLASVFVNGFDPGQGGYFSPAYAFYIFRGLYQAGLVETAENLIRQGWGWMLTQGLKTCVENFTLQDSHCHAWSASPAWYLSREVLGVKFPQLPDFSVVEIDIRSHHAWWAEGVYPHPSGDLHVKWEKKKSGIEVQCRAPAGVQVRVKAPATLVA